MKQQLIYSAALAAALFTSSCSSGGSSATGQPEPMYDCADDVVALVEKRDASMSATDRAWRFCLAAMDRIEKMGPDAEGYFAQLQLDVMDTLDAIEARDWDAADRLAARLRSFD